MTEIFRYKQGDSVVLKGFPAITMTVLEERITYKSVTRYFYVCAWMDSTYRLQTKEFPSGVLTPREEASSFMESPYPSKTVPKREPVKEGVFSVGELKTSVLGGCTRGVLPLTEEELTTFNGFFEKKDVRMVSYERGCVKIHCKSDGGEYLTTKWIMQVEAMRWLLERFNLTECEDSPEEEEPVVPSLVEACQAYLEKKARWEKRKG